MASITMFYDVISPYSLLAFEILQRSGWSKTVAIEYVPVHLGGIMQATGNRPPITVAAKEPWMQKDLARSCREAGLPPFRMPEGFPMVSTLLAQRVLAAIPDNNDRARATSALFRASLQEGRRLDEAAVRQALASAGFPSDVTDKLVAAAASPGVKAKLQKQTEQALALGAFGAPTIIVKRPGAPDEFFFGSDRFHQIAPLVGQAWPIRKSKL
ncbi:Glutathione S-transferase kappa [Plasmodiophora brassicae]